MGDLPGHLRRRGWHSATAFGHLRLVELAGPGALAQSARWVDQVQAATQVSRLAGRRWLEAWNRAFPTWEPWVLTLLDDGEPLAVAPLARRRTRWGVEAVSMGAGEADESVLAVRTDRGAEALATSIADALRALSSRWSLHLFQLPVGAPLTRALTHHVQPSRMWPSAGRPVLWLGAGPRTAPRADPDAQHPRRIGQGAQPDEPRGPRPADRVGR